MLRLWSALRGDMTLQFRYGFYYAGAVVTVIWAALLHFLPDAMLETLLPFLLFVNLNITTFYFVGGLVLFEKGEGVLEALVVSPLRIWEYLGSKVLTLVLLGLGESLLVVLFGYGTGFRIGLLIGGLFLLGVMYTLLGFIAVARYDAINEYLMPSFLYVMLIQLPFVDYLGLYESPVFYLWPTQGPLILLKGAFVTLETWELAYAWTYSILSCALLFWGAHVSFESFIIRRERRT